MNGPRIEISHRLVIFRRGKKGIYNASFHWDGQRRYRSLRTTRLKVARPRAMRLALALEDGTYTGTTDAALSPSAQLTIEQAQSEFVQVKLAEGRRRKTIHRYRGMINTFAEFCETKGVTWLRQIDLRLFDAYRTRRVAEIGPTTMHHEAVVFKQFFAWCAARQLLPGNLLASQTFRRPPAKRPTTVLSLDQVDSILLAAPERIRRPLAVLAFTGMRSAECRNLLVEDVKLEAGWIHVRSRKGAETKTGLDRSIPIHPRLNAALAPLVGKGDGYLFTAAPSKKYPRGDHWISTKRLNVDFVSLLKTLNIPAGREGGHTVHSLRHFFKTFCVNSGVPREHVDAWQGHSAIRSASDLYIHVTAQDSVRFMNQVPFQSHTSKIPPRIKLSLGKLKMMVSFDWTA